MRSPGLGLKEMLPLQVVRSNQCEVPGLGFERNVTSPGGSIGPMRSPGLGLKEMLPLQVVRSNQCEVLDLA